jgi:hypothetical protein
VFKYFWKHCSNSPLYAINANEREAAYVIDGLMHNDTIQSDIHSTDTETIEAIKRIGQK